MSRQAFWIVSHPGRIRQMKGQGREIKSYPPGLFLQLDPRKHSARHSMFGCRPETPSWPYAEQCTILQRTLILKCRRFRQTIRTCYLLIFLGFLTVLGILIPAIWRSVARHDIQDRFSLAQYILGVGVFVVGCMVAIHSRICTCWQ